MAFERGCTELSDESKYKCQTVEGDHGGDTESSSELTTMLNMIMFKPMIGNALRYCNCHGTGCNKDWASADGGEQATPAQASDKMV